MSLAFRLFGPIAVEVGGRVLGPRDFGGVKPKQVLEILLSERGRPVPKDRLADALWGDAQPERAAAALETYVSVLRKSLGLRRLVATEPGAYRAVLDDAELDLDRFDTLVARASREDLEAAISLVRGAVLEDEPYATWAIRLRDRYREKVLAARLAASDLAREAGRGQAALDHAQGALGADPASERAHRAAMRALAALGRRDEALRAFQKCRAALASELGVEPGPETTALRDAIAHGESGSGRTSPTRTRPAPADDVPLLGRREEIAMLGAAARASLEGEAAFLLVEGESGIGKTRLCDEVLSRLSCPIGRARSFELDRDLAFVPLAQAIRSLAPDVRDPALGDLLPEIGPTGLPPEVGRTHALEAFVRLVTLRAPLLLFFDDLQWADASTLSAIGYLLRRAATTPFVILATLRTEDAGPEHPARKLEPSLRLELGPLSPADVEPLGKAGLHEKTRGHALTLVEWVRASSDTGEGEMPNALRDLLLARARAAGPRAHRVLAIASVLARPFGLSVLSPLVGEPPSDVAEDLETLEARRLLVAVGDRLEFRHDLLRDAVRSSLSADRRQVLHARALDVLEAEGGDAADLARHALEAGAVGRALSWSIRAGDEARAHFANVEAAAHDSRALGLARDHPDLFEPDAIDALRVRAARTLVMLGRHEAAEPLLAVARASAETRGDDRALFEALGALSAARHRGASAPSEGLRVAEEAFRVAERIGEPLLLARAHVLVGGPIGSLGRLDEALDHMARALAAHEEAGAPPPAFPMARIALAKHFQAREAESISWSLRAESAAQGSHDEDSLLHARWIRGLAQAALGRTAEAWATLDSIAEVGRGEEVLLHARVPNTYGSILAELLQPARALERDLESLENARRSALATVKEAELQTILNLGADRLALGRVSEARADVETVRCRTAEVEYARFRWLARLHALDGEIALLDGDAERALGAADACEILGTRYGQPKNEVRAGLVRAKALAALGRRREATRAAREAAKKAGRLGLVGLEWRAAFAAHEISGAPADLARARKAVRAAADGAPEALREPFLATVPVPP